MDAFKAVNTENELSKALMNFYIEEEASEKFTVYLINEGLIIDRCIRSDNGWYSFRTREDAAQALKACAIAQYIKETF